MPHTMRVGCLKVLWLISLAVVALAGCVTESGPDSYRPRVRVGMSRDDLRAAFGKPLRVEAAAAGGEDWFYAFAPADASPVDTTTSYDSSGARTDSLSITLPDPRTKQELPIHLSAEGYVIEPLPEGDLVHR